MSQNTPSETLRVGFREKDTPSPYEWSEWRTGSSAAITLYNFRPDAEYEYKCMNSAGSNLTGDLTPDPTLPALLEDLNLEIDRNPGYHANYVMFDTYDCQMEDQYIVVVKPTAAGGYISWYQYIGVVGAGEIVTGWSWTADQTLLVNVDKSLVYEWDLAGNEVNSLDYTAECTGLSGDAGPCPHHGSYRLPGTDETYVLVGAADTTSYNPASDASLFSTCTAMDGFVDDGVQIYDGSFTLDQEFYYMADMGADPDVAAGPNTPTCTGSYWGPPFADDVVDWTHANSIYATDVAGVRRVTVSMREWDMILRYLPGTSTVDWILGGQGAPYTDFTLAMGAGVSGEDDFGGQHHVTEEGGDLLFFDNRTHVDGVDDKARAIRVELDPGAGTATIVRSWTMRKPGTSPYEGLVCTGGLGSAVLVPGTGGDNLLANCGPERTIQEIDEYDGNMTTDPLLQVTLPDGDYCKTNAEPTPTMLGIRWYRAWPLVELGEF